MLVQIHLGQFKCLLLMNNIQMCLLLLFNKTIMALTILYLSISFYHISIVLKINSSSQASL